MSRPSARPRTAYRCGECGWQTGKWVGRCGECQAWGSVSEVAAPATRRPATGAATAPSGPALPIGQVPLAETATHTTGVAELDRVLGGGMVPGAVVLLAGEPGVGKSTLLLDVAAQSARAGRRVLYVSGEESAAQVRLRADRCRAVHHELYLAAETDLEAVLAHIEEVRPDLLVVDSVQTVAAGGTEGVPGGVTQVKEVTAALVRQAKARDLATLLVGHVTKEGGVAGPRTLEHLVDVVLHFEGERSTRLRLVRALKNRFGPVDEVGCFDLTSDGIHAVADASGLFVSRHHEPVPGTCLTVALEGRRPLLAELQALVTVSAAERPRRTPSGVDATRLAVVLGVLEARAGLRLGRYDVFVSTVGGARLTGPAGDLALALAVASAASDRVLPPDLVAIGEIGLAGELRRVPELRRRLSEARRIGITRALVPRSVRRELGEEVDGLHLLPAPDVRAALMAVDLLGQPARP